MNQYPEYEEDGQERLFFPNRWRSIEPQLITGADCFNPNAVLNNEENLIVLKLTAIEFTEIFSALYNGAVQTYPDRFLQILVNFLAGLHCPPILEEQDCFEYPSYASFMQYSPSNPYLQPDEIPDGYLAAPFLVNGENGVDVPNYEHFDILVPFDSLTLDVNWFEDIGGQLPQITVMVRGHGKAYLKMLCQVQGGLAVITLDNPPNLLDILSGIITGADNIIDLNLDIVSLPPETATEIIYEVDVVGTGIHTIYIVFLPILDDSLIPLRFGGGFRGVQLCDFVEQPEMGIQDIRFDDVTCELQTLIDGVWTQVTGWENWLDCVPSGGGGGGGVQMRTKTYTINIPSNVTNSTTTYANAASVSHTPLYSKMLVIVGGIIVGGTSAGSLSDVRVVWDGNAGNDATVATIKASVEYPMSVSDWFSSVVPDVAKNISVQIKRNAASTSAVAYLAETASVTIIEFEDASDLFVEDIRINGEELQKKIGGVWITVSDSLKTLFDAVQAGVVSAQNAANSAIATNVSQAAQITVLQVNLGAVEALADDLDTRLTSVETVDIPQINTTLANHESRLDALEAASANFPWSIIFDFKVDDWDWVAAGGETWNSTNGWLSANGSGEIHIYRADLISDQRVTHMKLWWRAATGTYPQTYNAAFSDLATGGGLYVAGIGTLFAGWVKVPQNDGYQNCQIKIVAADGIADFQLEKVQFLGLGSDPFAGI